MQPRSKYYSDAFNESIYSTYTERTVKYKLPLKIPTTYLEWEGTLHGNKITAVADAQQSY